MDIQKKVILCVDDEKLVLTSLKAQLKNELGQEYIVETAESGEEALEIIEEIIQERKELPLVISDQIMPGIKGDDLLILIHHRLPKTLSIMLTGQANADAVGRALNYAGLYHYISKPWDETDLLLTMNEALRSYYQDKTIEQQKTELERLVRQLQDYNETLEGRVKERTHEIERQKQELASQRDVLEETNAAKDKLFAVIGHDLRNSLSALISILGTLTENYVNLDEHDRIESLSRTEKATHEMDRLLEHLLEWTRIQTGRVKFTPSAFDLHGVTEEMIRFMRISSDKKNIDIKQEIGPNTIVHADKNMIGTVLRNLLSNAIKFSPPGSCVTIGCHCTENAATNSFHSICVADQGAGIDPERIGALFQIAHSRSTPGTANEKGTGLGLLICKDLIEINGGSLSVDSTPGKGSRFTFTVPAWHE